MFVILTGSSGSGKNTVINELKKINDGLVLMPTYTTRDMRAGEKEGSPYFYISKDEFQNKIKNNELIEYEIIHNNFYGSSMNIFDQYLGMGKIIIKDIGVEGAQNLGIKLVDKTNIVKIFLTVRHKRELKKRLIDRGEKQIKLRLKRFSYEQKQMNKFDYVIYNNNLDKTVSYVNQILELKVDDFFITKKFTHLNKYLVKYYVNKLVTGRKVKPIKIALLNNSAYVIRGNERYVASLICNKPIAKIIIDKNIDLDRFKIKVTSEELASLKR